MPKRNLLDWLLSLPCILDSRVIIDVRGVYPVAHINDGRLTRVCVVTNEMDFIYFIIEHLD